MSMKHDPHSAGKYTAYAFGASAKDILIGASSIVESAKFRVLAMLVNPEFAGMSKVKFNIQGVNGGFAFWITPNMLEAYTAEELAGLILTQAAKRKIAPFKKPPAVKSVKQQVMSVPKAKSLHPDEKLKGKVDLTQVARMTCCPPERENTKEWQEYLLEMDKWKANSDGKPKGIYATIKAEAAEPLPKPEPPAYWISQIKYAIIHLNDTHKWTRNQIADWLETLDADLTIK